MGFEGQMAVSGTPLLQIFSAIIKPDDDDTIHQVYGTIQVEDAEVGEEYIFNCDPEDAATIRHQGKLLLLTTVRPFFATDDFTVTLDLKEINGSTEFVNESFTWNGPNLFSYANCCLSHDFRGKLGVVTIYFSVLTVAVDAFFGFKINESVGTATNIYGRIVAYYGRNFEFLEDNHNFRVILFDKTCKEEAVELDDKGFIPLLTDCLSVPSYSSVVIEANLHYTRSNDYTNGIIESRIEASAWDDVMITRHDGAFSVTAQWVHPNRFARLPSFDIVEEQKFFIEGHKLFELFSARIFYDQTTVEGEVEVSGRIRVYDGLYDMSLFSSRKDCNLILPDGTLALTGPTSSIQGSVFDLSLDVQERHQKFVIDGYLSISPSRLWDWLDSFTFATISGKNCYAVLHFVIFERAVQAELEVTLSSVGDSTIHGSLIAYYQNYGYDTNYLKKYFRTRLLDVPEEKPVSVSSFQSSVLSNLLEDELMPECEDDKLLQKSKLIEGVSEDTSMLDSENHPGESKHKTSTNEGGIISLERKVVAVPDKSCLTIEANLSCTTKIDISETVTHLICGLADFHPQTSGTTSARIGEEDVVIDVKVSWSNYSYMNHGKQRVDTKRSSSIEVLSEKKNKFN